jgi:hypothetical protein
MAQRLEPDDHVQDDKAQSSRSRPSAVKGLQARTGGFVARHPALLKTLQWLGWNNPGGSMNP